MTYKYPKCAYPGCDGGHVTPRSGKSDLCAKHEEMFRFVLWVIGGMAARDRKQRESGLGLAPPGTLEKLQQAGRERK